MPMDILEIHTLQKMATPNMEAREDEILHNEYTATYIKAEKAVTKLTGN